MAPSIPSGYLAPRPPISAQSTGSFTHQAACVASLSIQTASRALTTNHPTVMGVTPDSTDREPQTGPGYL